MAGEKFVKYKDGKFITDDSGGGGGQYLPLIYSDEEREVGVWRDGKPLYQKTIVSTYSFHQTGVHTIAIDIHDLDIDTPVSIDGFWRRWAGDGNKLWYQYGSEESTYGIGWARIDSENSYTNGRLAIEIRSDGTDLQIVTLQYTKSTDTPGSGTWTPSGGYAHHYSTTEQVIGTWIDGKPLYEKAILFSQGVTLSTNWTDINVNVPIDLIVYASAYRNSDGFYNILKASQGNSTGEISIRLESGSFSADVVLIQYTKTTD